MKEINLKSGRKLKHIPVILMAVYFIYSLYNLQKKNLINGYLDSGYRGGIFLIEIAFLVFLIILLYYKKEFKIEKKFVLIASSVGIALTIITPMWQVPDEVVHSFRAYDLAKGRILYQRHEDSMVLPKSMYDLFDKIDDNKLAFKPQNRVDKAKFLEGISMPLNKEITDKYYGNNTEAYLFVAYLPQAIGIFIGDLFNLPVYFVLMLGRLINLAFWITMGYFTLRFMPIKKELMMFIMLLPMSVYQAASLSPDAVLNSCSFLLIAYILHLKFNKENVELKDVGIVLLLTIGIVSVKMPYVLISALLLTIPKEKFNSLLFPIPKEKLEVKRKLKYLNLVKMIVIFICILSIDIIIFAGWNKLSAPVKNTNISEVEESTNEEIEGYSMGQTAVSIINNPKRFLDLSKNTLKENGEFYKESLIAKFGWLDTEVPKGFVNLIFIILLIIAINGERAKKVTIWDRFVFLSLGIGFYLILCAVSLQWYNGMDNINEFKGIQGRYFLPFAICPLLALYQSKIKFDLEKYSWIVPSICSYSLVYCLNVILVRYWVY